MNLRAVFIVLAATFIAIEGDTVAHDRLEPFAQPDPVTISEKAAVKFATGAYFKPQLLIEDGCVVPSSERCWTDQRRIERNQREFCLRKRSVRLASISQRQKILDSHLSPLMTNTRRNILLQTLVFSMGLPPLFIARSAESDLHHVGDLGDELMLNDRAIRPLVVVVFTHRYVTHRFRHTDFDVVDECSERIDDGFDTLHFCVQLARKSKNGYQVSGGVGATCSGTSANHRITRQLLWACDEDTLRNSTSSFNEATTAQVQVKEAKDPDKCSTQGAFLLSGTVDDQHVLISFLCEQMEIDVLNSELKHLQLKFKSYGRRAEVLKLRESLMQCAVANQTKRDALRAQRLSIAAIISMLSEIVVRLCFIVLP
ncbi:unnamed protein product [Phytophthora lilii]|uniref:Unnamed protein product n=1 Tax=Phytophthora lilii TaxID=2077276 RepID=A0A9W7CQ83_9STRA|nr:unnamed protein product [Phytophthora lilii]